MIRLIAIAVALTGAVLLAGTAPGPLALIGRVQAASQGEVDYYWQAYLTAQQAAWQIYYQQPQLYGQYLQAERNAWNAYLAKRNELQAELNLLGLQQQVAQVDAALNAWASYGQTLWQRCDPTGYATDANYRAQCDNWVRLEGGRVQNYIGQLQAYRANLAGGGGGGSAPNPPRCGRDPNDPMADLICR
jgi:hypothetical protein